MSEKYRPSLTKQGENQVQVVSEGKSININFGQDRFTVTAHTSEGATLANWESKDITFKSAAGECFSLHKLESWEIKGNKIDIVYQTNNSNKQIAIQLGLETEDVISFDCWLATSDPMEWAELSFAAAPNEHFYGFGEKFDRLDQRGKVVDLWVKNGASRDETYKPIPFFFSTGNYGVYIETTFHCICEVCVPHRNDRVGIAVNEAQLKFHLILGDTPLDIISRYTTITGRSAMPPKWAFGPWKSRFAADQKRHIIYEDADKHRELGIPCSVIVLDGWWDEDGFSPRFSYEYPKGEQMVENLHEQGFKVIGWIAPWIVKGPRSMVDWERCASLGYFIKNSQGEPYVCRLTNGPNTYGSLVDFTNPEAVAWWKKRIEGFVKLGIDGIKTDFGEQVPADSVFFNGKTGKEMHNVYPKIYNQYTWDVIKEIDGVLFGRSAWAGSQQYPGVWAGDQTADFCPWTGLGSTVIAGQAIGMSGFPFWASDIGGYFGAPNKDCFIRWSQLGAFSPWMQIHGNGCHEPWGFDNETMDIYRKYATIHTRLFPYLYSYAQQACETGYPIIRALPLYYSDDQNIYQHDFASYQYLLGKELLVAPIVWSDDTKRRVYLPKGKWMDFWNHQEFAGEQDIWYDAAQDTIPVFVPEGSIIPFLSDYVDTLAPSIDPSVKVAGEDLSLMVYAPDQDAKFTMYDGTEFNYVNTGDEHTFTVTSSTDRVVNVDFYNTQLAPNWKLTVATNEGDTLTDQNIQVSPSQTGFEMKNVVVKKGITTVLTIKSA